MTSSLPSASLSGSVPSPATLASFFHRLATIDRIARVIVSDAQLSARLTFRGRPDRSVRLEFTSGPLRVVDDDSPLLKADVDVAMDAGVAHEVFLGRLAPGEAFGRRQMLLRGSAAQLARLIPLFDFAPALYREHLADIGWEGFVRRSGWAPLRENNMATSPSYTHTALGPERSAGVQVACRAVESLAYGLGFAVGLVRHRVVPDLDLFDVIAAASRGITDASPAVRPDGDR
jgi:hypothetical protein